MHPHTMVMTHGNLLIFFYKDLAMNMKQLLESLCNGQFLTKFGDEALEFYAYVADLAKGWEES